MQTLVSYLAGGPTYIYIKAPGQDHRHPPTAMKTLLLLLGVLQLAALTLAQQLQWWQTGVVYQVYPRSLKDADGDGTGDLRGILASLEYLAGLGVAGVWIQPVFKSPMADNGYDVSDWTQVDPIFGTTADLQEIIARAHELGLKVVIDFVMNHSSDEHEWFRKATDPSDPDHAKYKNYYVFMDGKLDVDGTTLLPPNNWQGEWGGSVWTWNEATQQFYLHQFTEKQPDLNYRNPELVDEMKTTLRYWLDMGADGFRMDAVPHLVEKGDFADYYPGNGTDNPLVHQPETYALVREFRALLDAYPGDRVMMTDAIGTLDEVLDYYGNATHPGAHFSFNFLLIFDVDRNSTARDFVDVIQGWIDVTTERQVWSNWLVGNHDKPRAGSRFSADLVDGLNMLALLLPGTAVTYYGEEIGMLDNRNISCEVATDPLGCLDNVTLGASRDPQRTPFQWDASLSAGFSSNPVTWLPVNENYPEVNVAAEDLAQRSVLKTYKRLVALRKDSLAVQQGATRVTSVGDVLAFSRELSGSPTVLVALNVGQSEALVDLEPVFNLPAGTQLQLYANSLNSGLTDSSPVPANGVFLEPQAAAVFYVIS